VKPAQNFIALAVAVAVVLVIGVVVASLWSGIGDSEISIAGWLALAAGVVVTLGLGIGLMALVFISSRRGYDEGGRHQD
jgi:hypothetical protein